jgi:signal recognition particle GTPase
LYVTAERGSGEELAMRIMMGDGDEVIGHSDQWGDLDQFADESIIIVSRVLGLSDETPYQLM